MLVHQRVIPKIMTRILWTSRFRACIPRVWRNTSWSPQPSLDAPAQRQLAIVSSICQIPNLAHASLSERDRQRDLHYLKQLQVVLGKARKRYKSKTLHFIFVEITDQNVFICAPQPTQGARRLQRPQRPTFARSFSGRPELSNTCQLAALTSHIFP